MYNFYGDIASKRTKTKILLTEDEAIHNLFELARCFGEQDPQIDTTLLVLSNEILHDAFNSFKNGLPEQAVRKISELEQFRNAYGSKLAKDFITFHVSRLYAYGFCCTGSWLKAVRAANIAISRCPIVNGARAQGLVDVLILLSDAYSALNKFDDAVHSAKIAVDVAQEQFDQHQQTKAQQRGTKHDPRTPLGPLLNHTTTVSVAYFNLATQLRNGDMIDPAIGWYERALFAAQSNRLDANIVAAFELTLKDTQRILVASPVIRPIGSPSQRHTPLPILEDSRSNDLTVPEVEGTLRPPVYAQSQRGQPSESDRRMMLKHIGVNPEEDPSTPTRGDPASVPGRGENSRGVRPSSREKPPSPGPPGPPHRALSAEEEIAFVAASNRQRPKSAVSKLGGGYDSASALDKSLKDGAARKMSSNPSAVIPGKSQKRLPPVHYAEVSGTGGDSHSDIASIRDSLARQLMSLVQFRLNVDVQKEQLLEEERMVRALEKQKQINDIKNARSNELRILVEMGFERQCGTDEKLGNLETLLRAQNLQMNFGPTENPGDRFFEGMVVDVKRSLKANAERDRSVIVRCRVNGTFDAEIIQTGELIINIQPSLIRVPPPPEEMMPSDREEGGESSRAFRESQRVQCLALSGSKWFTGYIERVYNRGLYKVEYLDGSSEDNVPVNRIRSCSGNEHSQCASFKYVGSALLKAGRVGQSVDETKDLRLVQPEQFYVGQQVLMRFVYGLKWRLGTIMKIREDGHAYDVLLAGRQEVEKGVQASCIRHVSSLLYGYGDDSAASNRSSAPTSPLLLSPPGTAESGLRSRSASAEMGLIRPGAMSPSGRRMRSNTAGDDLISSRDNNIRVLHKTNHVQSETRALVSDTDQGQGMPPVPGQHMSRETQQENSAIALRDRYAQEMHHGAALLNASAAERKLARAMRQERTRLQSATKIQALMRGARIRMHARAQMQVIRKQKLVQREEEELASSESELLDRYAQALSLAVSRELQEAEHNALERERESLTPVQTRPTLPRAPSFGDEAIEERLVHIHDAVADESKQHVLAMEKMRAELMEMHQSQMELQRKELEGVLEREIKSLSRVVAEAVKSKVETVESETETSEPKVSVSLSLHDLPSTSLLAINESTELEQECAEEITEYGEISYESEVASRVPSIQHMKDMYLPLWGCNTFEYAEVVSIVASATVDYSVIGAAVDNEVYPPVHTLNDSDVFKNVHWVFFTKDASPDPFYLLKVRLNDASGKSCKLKFPGSKINDICVSRKAVNVTLNEQTKFEICATSLRIDTLAIQMEALWNAHIAWASQSVLITLALHKNLQNLVNQYGAFFGQGSLHLPMSGGWITERFTLMEDLMQIRQQQAEAKQHYEATVMNILNDIRAQLSQWGYFPKTSGDSDEDCTAVVMALSNGLSELAGTVMEPFRDFISYSGIVDDGPVDTTLFSEYLRSRYGSEYTVNPILKRIYVDFAYALNIPAAFEKLALAATMHLSHQTLVHAFAHPDLFNWNDWCRQNRDWAISLIGYSDTNNVDHAVVAAVMEDFKGIVKSAEGNVFIMSDGVDISQTDIFKTIEKFCENVINLSQNNDE